MTKILVDKIKYYHIVFWQPIVTPHMFYLAKSLALKGHRVTYISSEIISADRSRQGWEIPTDTDGILDVICGSFDLNELFENFNSKTIHLTSGITKNALPESLGSQIRASGGIWGAMVETIDERFGLGLLKKIKYQILLRNQDSCPDFLLAIGINTLQWFVDRGFRKDKIFKFTYFLNNNKIKRKSGSILKKTTRIAYFGQLIHRKNIDSLILALDQLTIYDFEINIYGTGPDKDHLVNLANKSSIRDKIFWHGVINMEYVSSEMTKYDFVVLPSYHDGWGAVVSEALMVGVPVLCSTSCGASEVVFYSKSGGIFNARRLNELIKLLKVNLDKGSLCNDESEKISDWAKCLNAESGADYLIKIFEHLFNHYIRPEAPWEVKNDIIY